MSDKVEIRVKFKIGEIEFEAEGSADLVERERSIFSNTLLPSAVDAIVRTRGVAQATQYIEAVEQPTKQLVKDTTSDAIADTAYISAENDYSRMNLASFLKKFGTLSEQDFALFSAFFDEMKNGKKSFTKDDLERYYTEARRTVPSNISMSLNQLAQKGLIMDAVDVEQKLPKPYMVSSEGISYIQSYKPKEEGEKKTSKPRKSRPKAKSNYSGINCDELSLGKYPEVKSLKDFKEKMMMVLYIITKEGKGEWFSTTDVLYLLMDVFGEHTTKDQVNGVFKREKLWFKSEKVDGNDKEIKRKLLNKGLEFAQSLVANTD